MPEAPGAAVARNLADREEVIEHLMRKIEVLEGEARLKDRFLAALGHDLRAPIHAVLGWTQLLRREPLDSARRDRALLTIERNACFQAALIDELLDVSRMSRGTLALHYSACDVGQLVRGVVEAARSDADRCGIELALRASDEAIVAGDRSRLEQIFTNLVSNALKFTPAGGSVELRVTRASRAVRVEVRDTGKGFGPERVADVCSVLGPGGDVAPTREGLGIGLFVARRLAELHGGSMHVSSEGERGGAVFTVLLPFGEESPSEDTPATSRDERRYGELAGLEILVVEDDADSAELLSRALVARGGSITSARDGITALALAHAKRPEVIVTDLGLPDIDGYELVRRVRADRGAGIGIVALTGLMARHRDATNPGFDDRLLKPVDISRLVRAIRDAASSARARAESVQ